MSGAIFLDHWNWQPSWRLLGVCKGNRATQHDAGIGGGG
jgi:hypothetical protein